jgi:hypothetical protein
MLHHHEHRMQHDAHHDECSHSGTPRTRDASVRCIPTTFNLLAAAFTLEGWDKQGRSETTEPHNARSVQYAGTQSVNGVRSAEVVIPLLLQFVTPESVVDLGRKDGEWLSKHQDWEDPFRFATLGYSPDGLPPEATSRDSDATRVRKPGLAHAARARKQLAGAD